MKISIGLPNTLDHPGPLLAEWARRAEDRGFASLGTLDRIVYPSYDSMVSLSVAAGATSRIGLISNILLGPLYPPVWLAKAAAGLDAISGGRLTLGLGVGNREDDFAAMGRSVHERGHDMDELLATMRTVFSGRPLGDDAFPVAGHGRPGLLIGGNSDAAVRRVVEYGDGWVGGGGTPEQLKPMVDRVRQAWKDAGRDGEPRFAALAYFGLSDEEASRRSLRTYYAFVGEAADMIAEGARRTPQAVRDAAAAFAEIGIDELVFAPTVPDLAEVDRLADAVL